MNMKLLQVFGLNVLCGMCFRTGKGTKTRLNNFHNNRQKVQLNCLAEEDSLPKKTYVEEEFELSKNVSAQK